MEQQFRIEMYRGKQRKMFLFACEQCGGELWKPLYYKQRFCKPECSREYRRRPWKGVETGVTKYCSKCTTIKAVGEFRANANRRDGLQVWCLLCESNNKARWYKDNIERVRPRLIARQKALKEAQKKVLWDYLLGHPCIDCGEGDPIVLDFDHVSGKKKYNVSIILGKHTLKAMMAEIDKCVVRCSNCHRRKTAKERKTWRNTFGLLAPM